VCFDQRLETERLAREEAERTEAERQAKLIREEQEKLERKKVTDVMWMFLPFCIFNMNCFIQFSLEFFCCCDGIRELA